MGPGAGPGGAQGPERVPAVTSAMAGLLPVLGLLLVLGLLPPRSEWGRERGGGARWEPELHPQPPSALGKGRARLSRAVLAPPKPCMVGGGVPGSDGESVCLHGFVSCLVRGEGWPSVTSRGP